jgi:hypothetical protein
MGGTVFHLARRIDCFCARINGGLTAVAVVLAVMVVGAGAGRELRARRSTLRDRRHRPERGFRADRLGTVNRGLTR